MAGEAGVDVAGDLSIGEFRAGDLVMAAALAFAAAAAAAAAAAWAVAFFRFGRGGGTCSPVLFFWTLRKYF